MRMEEPTEPSPRRFKHGSLAVYEERMEGWIDRALSGAK
jgi:hypothetical protein